MAGAIHSPAGRNAWSFAAQKEGAHGGTLGSPCSFRGTNKCSQTVLVEASAVGVPVRVNRLGVAVLREEWRVVDRWWTDDPVDRRYFDLVLESGQNACVFRDEEAGCWFSQRA